MVMVPIAGKARLNRRELLALSCVCALSFVADARAEPDGAMGQGQAAIAVRSDVKLGIKGTGGTTSERLAKLGQAVGDQMGDIRACYRKQIAGSPELIGALRVRIALDKSDKPQVELTEQSAGSKELTACVSRALEKGHYHDVGRPAAALLSLEFDNSRARGQAEMVERQTQLGHADAHAASNGGQIGSWSSDGGQLKFTVQTEQAAPAGALDLVIRGFQAGYAAFLDCRRKCEKGGASPEGDIEAELSIDGKARATTHLGKISVAHERAPACAERAFKRVRFDKPQAPVRAQVTVHFAP
jgi:hypothetical protein